MLLPLLACAAIDPDDTGAAPFQPPDAPGPYAVGSAEDLFVGPDGVEHAVQVWFPATDAAGVPEYAYDDWFEASARADATPDCTATRPVLVFSHGNSAIRYQSVFLTEHLASHGWVVVAPDHTGNTLFDYDATMLGALALRRPVDITAAFDWLVDSNAGGLLPGCVDPDAGYAVAGHSFGGYTALAVAGASIDPAAVEAYCATADAWLCDDVLATLGADPSVRHLGDPRVWAAVAHAPAGHEVLVGGLADIGVPTLLLGGTLDTLTPMDTQVRPDYEGLVVSPHMLGTIEGAGHFGFSDTCAMIPTHPSCGDPYIPDAVTHPIVATASTAFLAWVRGEAAAAAWLPDPDAAELSWEQSP